MAGKTYEGRFLREISFPLGGIGAGSVGLAGNGRLIDWEIFNRPNRQSVNGYTNFAVKAEYEGKVLDARLVQGDTESDFTGGMHTGHHSWGFGHGPSRTTLAGLKHFGECKFKGFYPVAETELRDGNFPGKLVMRAFNPFIPTNADDSSIPAAFFEFEIENTSDKALDYTVALSVYNPLHKKTVNAYFEKEGIKGISMTTARRMSKEKPGYGNACIATDCNDVSYQEYWFRSGWFDDVTTFWREFSAPGKLANRHYGKCGTSDLGNGDMCTLAARFGVPAGAKGTVRFVISWYFPVFEKYWAPGIVKFLSRNFGFLLGKRKTYWKNYYAKLFSSSEDVAGYCLGNWDRLRGDTLLFRDALASSSLPAEVLDAVQGNIAVLKSSTCMRLTNGEFYGFEGSNKTSGSCEGTCDHVWGYAYALPFLFPELERSIREITYTYDVGKNGSVTFRSALPLGKKPRRFHPCADGQFGNIIKFVRDYKISGDEKFLDKYWDTVKKTLEFAWDPKNKYRWDPEQSGVLRGRQHHTLDVELFGANSWLTGYYICALQALADIAEKRGEKDTARKYRSIAARGKAFVEKRLFNGRFYVQDVDVKDKNVTDAFNCSRYYFNEETGEIKYQIGNGCEIDQVVAEWHARLTGAGRVFDEEHCRRALRSIYELNFKSMREVSNPCRIFALDDEKGVTIAAWENAADKPKIPVPYAEETMTGFEYAVACNMLMHGMENEALEIVRAVRERYDGYKRNPWSEIECGASYARAMASYSFVIAYSGFTYDLSEGYIGFNPVRFENGYSTFWSVGKAFGKFMFRDGEIILEVLYGKIELKKIGLPESVKKITECNIPYKFADGAAEVAFKGESGSKLVARVEI